MQRPAANVCCDSSFGSPTIQKQVQTGIYISPIELDGRRLSLLTSLSPRGVSTASHSPNNWDADQVYVYEVDTEEARWSEREAGSEITPLGAQDKRNANGANLLCGMCNVDEGLTEFRRSETQADDDELGSSDGKSLHKDEDATRQQISYDYLNNYLEPGQTKMTDSRNVENGSEIESANRNDRIYPNDHYHNRRDEPLDQHQNDENILEPAKVKKGEEGSFWCFNSVQEDNDEIIHPHGNDPHNYHEEIRTREEDSSGVDGRKEDLHRDSSFAEDPHRHGNLERNEVVVKDEDMRFAPMLNCCGGVRKASGMEEKFDLEVSKEASWIVKNEKIKVRQNDDIRFESQDVLVEREHVMDVALDSVVEKARRIYFTDHLQRPEVRHLMSGSRKFVCSLSGACFAHIMHEAQEVVGVRSNLEWKSSPFEAISPGVESILLYFKANAQKEIVCEMKLPFISSVKLTNSKYECDFIVAGPRKGSKSRLSTDTWISLPGPTNLATKHSEGLHWSLQDVQELLDSTQLTVVISQTPLTLPGLSLAEDISKFYRSSEFKEGKPPCAEIAVVCEKTTLLATKSILIARSKVFERMLRHKTRAIIYVNDARLRIMRNIIDYMHTDRCQMLETDHSASLEELDELLTVALIYQIPSLVREVCTRVAMFTDASTVMVLEKTCERTNIAALSEIVKEYTTRLNVPTDLL